MTAAVGRRPPGPAPSTIPPALAGVLDASHRTGRPVFLSVAGADDRDVKELLKLARVHARREGKSLRTRWLPAPGARAVCLSIAMTDKRPYARKAAPNGQEQEQP